MRTHPGQEQDQSHELVDNFTAQPTKNSRSHRGGLSPSIGVIQDAHHGSPEHQEVHPCPDDTLHLRGSRGAVSNDLQGGAGKLKHLHWLPSHGLRRG
eukprot:3865205-Amphidinium_carterae.1